MYRKILLALLLLTLPLRGDPPTPHSAAVDPLGLIHGCVSVITGDYIETKPDIVVNCHEPIVLWRVHVSDANHPKCHSQWRIGLDKIETFIWNKKSSNGHLFYRQDETGSVIRFRVDPLPKKWSLRSGKKPHWQALPEIEGYSNTSSGELSGQTNLLNDHLLYDSTAEEFTLTRGNGEKRIYKHHGKWSRRGLIKKAVGFLSETYGNPPNSKHETFLLARVRRPNGNQIHYQYDGEGRPIRIASTNSDCTVVFGWIEITYLPTMASVTTSDGQTLAYYTEKRKKGVATLQRVYRNGVIEQDYEYNTYGCNNPLALSHRYEPNGRHRWIEYYFTGDQTPHSQRIFLRKDDPRLGRVSIIHEPCGPDGSLQPRYAIYYDLPHNLTRTFDTLGNQTYYYINDNRLAAVVYYDGTTPIKTIRQTFDKSDLVSRSIDGGSTRRFVYDNRHNVVAEYLDDLLIRTCTYGHFNLLTSETAGDLTTTYTYQPDTNLLLHKQTHANDTLIQEEQFVYDHNAALIRHETHSGPQHLTTLITNRPDGLPLIIEEHADTLLKKTHLHYDDRNQVIQEDTYDATDTLAYTTTATYDARRRPTATTDPLGHLTTYTYDSNDNLLTTTNTQQTTTTYDSMGRPTSTTTGDLTTRTTYNPLDRPTTTTDPYGNITTYAYDPLSRLTTQTLPTGATITHTYDPHDRPLTETDPLGHTTHTTYDPRGNPLTVTYPDSTTETFTYNPAGHLITHTARNGLTTTYTRDPLGRPTSTTTPHSHTQTTYTGHLLATHTDPLNLHTTYTYDQAGRLIAQTTPETSLTYTYDPLSRLATRLQNDLRLTTYTYDHLDRLLTEQSHALTTYTYDPDGNLLTQTTGPSTTTHTYDAHNRLLSTTDPCGALTTHTYHPHLLITTHPDNTQTHTHLDPLQRPILIEKHAQILLSRTAYTYDLAGNLLLEDHHRILNGQTLGHYRLARTYDPAHRLLTLTENDTRTTTHTYNHLGQLTQTTHPDATTHTFTYHPSGLLATDPLYTYTYDPAGNITQAGHTHRTYDTHSRLISETLANGLTLTYTYDSFHRPLTITLPDQTLTTYTYDAHHLLTLTRPTYTHHYLAYNHLSQPILEELPNHKTRTTTYDPAGRILTIDDQTFTYDLMGNLTSDTTSTYTYDSLNQLILNEPLDSLHNPPNADHLNQLTTIPHDSRGRPTSYTFDTLNRLTQTPTHTYTYDAFHRRITTQTPTQTIHYLWTDLHEVGAYTDHITQYRPLGLTPNAEIGSAPAFELNSITHIPTYDNRGCVIALDDTPITYTPYGTPSSTPSPWLFCSKRYDPETALTYFGRRHYSSTHRRFLTPDPLGHTPGPNLYAYCSNNPLSLLDPYGEADAPSAPAPGQSRRVRVSDPRVCWTGCLTNSARMGAAQLARLLPARSESFVAGSKPIGDLLTVRYVNGTSTWRAKARSQAEFISDNYLSVACHVSHNPHQGLLSDAARCGQEWLFGYRSPAVNQLARDIHQDFERMGPKGIVVLIPWSEGVMVTDFALDQLKPWQTQNIYVLAAGGPKFIDKRKAALVENFTATGDAVAALAWRYHRNDDLSRYNINVIDGKGHRLIGGPYDDSLRLALSNIDHISPAR